MPGQEGVDGVAELGDLAGGVDVGEAVERCHRAFVVVGEIEAVQFAERVPGCFEPWMGGEQDVKAGLVGGVELVGSAHQQESRPEHVAVESGLGAFGAALDVAAHRGEPGLEPSDDVEPVQDVAGVAEPRLYRCFVRRRAVGDDDLHRFAPSGPLGGQERAERLGVAVGHHGEHPPVSPLTITVT